MLSVMNVKEAPAVVCGASRNRKNSDAGKVQLYGWDARTASGNGPDELHLTNAGSQRLLEALRGVPGRSWFGPVNCSAAGERACRFFAVVHSLADCAAAMVYCDESKAGPAELVVVIPAERRTRLRAEFAFEFVAFASFLGCIGAGADLSIHDWIAAAIAETDPSDALVLSISTGLWTIDQDYMLSRCVEKIAIAMVQWMREPQ
jgi:hypothetical protein